MNYLWCKLFVSTAINTGFICTYTPITRIATKPTRETTTATTINRVVLFEVDSVVFWAKTKRTGSS